MVDGFYTKDHFKAEIDKFGWEIGEYSYGRPNVVLPHDDRRLFIGKFCSIAGGVNIFLFSEHRSDWVTTYPFSVLSGAWPTARPILGHPTSKGNVVIGHDVWIGDSATIMSGVTIGNGAVIANRAVIMDDVPDYGIAIGNPGRTFRKRFNDATVTRLLKLKWWDWPDDKIREALPVMCSIDVELFLRTYEVAG